jgi:hypothetical protein
MSIIPRGMQYEQPSGLELGGIPISNPATDAAPVPVSTVASPSPQLGASAFQAGFEPIPTDPQNGGPQ